MPVGASEDKDRKATCTRGDERVRAEGVRERKRW